MELMDRFINRNKDSYLFFGNNSAVCIAALTVEQLFYSWFIAVK